MRDNAEGLAGLRDKPKPGRPCQLSEGQQAALRALVLRGPDPEKDGISRHTIADLCRLVEERFHVRYAEPPMGRLLKRLGLSLQKARPVPPQDRPGRSGALQKGGLKSALREAARANPGKRLELCVQDEARAGNKGRVTRRWYERGQRPPGLCDRRFTWAYIFTAVRPATGEDFTLVMPTVSTAAMSIFLEGFAARLAPDVHAVLVLDQAGWHGANALRVPDNVTLVPLPPYSPELNPVESVWLHLRERYLSHRLLDDYDAIADACCTAWNALTANPETLRSIMAFPWIPQITS